MNIYVITIKIINFCFWEHDPETFSTLKVIRATKNDEGHFMKQHHKHDQKIIRYKTNHSKSLPVHDFIKVSQAITQSILFFVINNKYCF